MRFCVVLFFAIVVVSQCSAAKKKGNIKEGDNNYYTLLSNRIDAFVSAPDAIVLFCVNNEQCSVSKTIFNLLAAEEDQLGVKFGYFDSTPDYAPILKMLHCQMGDFAFFQNGELHNKIPMNQIKKVSDLRDFVERSAHDLLPEVTTMAEFEEQVRSCNGEYSTVVYFASKQQNEELEKSLLQMFLRYDNIFQFRAMRNPDLIYEAGETENTVKVYQCYDHKLTKEFTHTVTSDIDALKQWILHKGMPFVTKSSTETIRRAIELFGLCIVVAIPSDQEDTVIPQITDIAKKLDSAGFVWNSEVSLKDSFIDSGATGKVFPTALALRSINEAPIVWNEKHKFTDPHITKWIRDIQNNEEELFKKSAPVPPVTDAPVQTLVYDNFVQTVSNPKKPAVVLFYGRHSRCPDCYNAMESFQKVAQSLKKSLSTSFYQYNIVENYLAQPVTRLPEIFLYKDDVIARFPDRAFTPSNVEKWLRSYFPRVHDEL
uniref:Protein disulfide isomerase n=1 Tax=Vannella robusta TaxID=1487602 RepID=A0A7S4HPY1_9EUKA|mmetsp:Transcript_14020/g.17673  ORF Transcript_14020/g.17673 Transcript_14020/m.17673 type:complete len:485 (+) Transcript_14020:214-1668(+)